MLKAKSVQSAAVFLVLASAPLAHAFASDAVGEALVARGSVTIAMPNKAPIALKTKDPVYRDATVATGTDSAAQIRFLDDTLLNLGHDSVVLLDDFMVPREDSAGLFVITLAKGYFRFVTGLIAKKDPKTVRIGMPFGTIGVRGSAATVMVTDERAIVAVTKCCIDVTAEGKTVALDVPGFYSEIRPNQRPSEPVRLTNDLAALMAAGLTVTPNPRENSPVDGSEQGDEPRSPETSPLPGQQGLRLLPDIRDVATNSLNSSTKSASPNAQGTNSGVTGGTTQPPPQKLFVAPRDGALAAQFSDVASIRERLNIDANPEREVLFAHHPASSPPTQAIIESQPPYLTWGYWKAGVNAGGQPVQDADGYMPFLSGVLSSIGALPQAGTATYQGNFGLFTTDEVQPGEANFLDGAFSMQFDFGNRTVTNFSGSGSPQTGTTINIYSTAAAPFLSPDNPTFQIPLQVDAVSSSGTMPMGAGTAMGGLFGPTGQTTGGVIQVPSWGPDGYVVHGTFVGTRTE